MNTLTHTSVAPRLGSAALYAAASRQQAALARLARLAEALRSLNALRSWWPAPDRLAGLDDHLLRDIGVDPDSLPERRHEQEMTRAVLGMLR